MSSQGSRMALLALAALAVASPSCDKLKSSVAKLTAKKAAATPEAEASGPKPEYRSEQVSTVNEANYNAFITRPNTLAVVDFNASWCGPCKMMAPVLKKATEEHPGVVYVGSVDVDAAPRLAQNHGVQSIPDIRLFKDGREVDRFVGFPGEAAVLEKIAQHSKGITPTVKATPAGAPVAQAAAKGETKGEMKPLQKDWLPPGMTRKGDTAAQHPAAAARQ